MKAIKVLGCVGCWACIICAAIFYDFKAAAIVAMAILLEAIVAAVMIVEVEKICDNTCAKCMAEHEETLRKMQNDGK